MIQTIRTQINDQWQLLNVTQYKKPAFEAYEMKNSFISLDQAFEYVGDNSRYQQRITLILSLQFLCYSFFVMGMPFLFLSPKFCTLTYCSETQICDDSLFELLGFNSITKEFKLFCGHQSKQSFIAAYFFIGQMFGGFTFPIFANIWGRKILLLFGCLLGGLAILAASFSTSVLQLYIFFFLAGFGLSGYETVVYVYITEISALRFRSIASSILVVVWSSSMLVYPFIVERMFSWRTLMRYSISIPLLVTVGIGYLYFVESPRWLASKQKYQECREVFRTMSIFNKRRPFEFNFIEELDKFNNKCVQLRSTNQSQSYLHTKEAQKTQYSYWSILSHSKLLRITMILIWMWFLRYFTYYGLQFSVYKFGISVTTALRALSVVELLTGLSSLYFKLKYARIISIQLCLLTMTIGALLTIINIPQFCYSSDSVCWQQLLHLLSAILIKAAITIYNSILNTYTGEVYVTSLRSYGYGFCMTLGQLGSSFAPVYVQYISEYSDNASPMTIVAGLALFGALITTLLPETFKQDMFDNIEDQLLATEMVTLNYTDPQK